MPDTNWTLISGSTPQDYIDTAVFEVNPDTKQIALITGQALVAGEKDSQYISFLMPRYWDGIDISSKAFTIEYALAGTYYGTSEAVNAEMTSEQVRFGWIVPETACAISGTLLFILKITSEDYVLKTQIAEHPVFKTINVEDVVPEPTKEIWYREFQTRVDSAISEAEAAVDTAQATLTQVEASVGLAQTAAQEAQTAEDNAEAAAASAQIRYGSPLVAQTADEMAEQNRVYVYTGSETGYTAGHWYYYNGTEWTDGGVYNGSAVNTDATLTQAGMAADAKATGDEISQIKEDFTNTVNSAYVTDSASGSVAHFVDGADNIPMKSVKVNIEPIQSGSGDPSPSNVRPITGYDSVKVYHSGADTADATEYNISLTSAGTVYGGTLDVVSGVLTVDKGFVTLDGTQTIANRNWRATSNSVGWLYPYSLTQNVVPNSSAEVPDVISNRVKTASYSAAYNGTENNCVSLVYDTSKVYGLAVRCDNTLLTTDAAINAFLAENPIQVVYSLATPLTYQLSATEIKSLLGINNVWSDAGDVEVEYRADTKLYIERLTEPDADMIADSNIVSGQYFMVGNNLYKATANIANGAQIIVGTNCISKSLSEALNEINA